MLCVFRERLLFLYFLLASGKSAKYKCIIKSINNEIIKSINNGIIKKYKQRDHMLQDYQKLSD